MLVLSQQCGQSYHIHRPRTHYLCLVLPPTSLWLHSVRIKINAAVMINNNWWLWRVTADLTHAPTTGSRRDFHQTQEENGQLTYDVESSLVWLARTPRTYRKNPSPAVVCSVLIWSAVSWASALHTPPVCFRSTGTWLEYFPSRLSCFSEMLSTVWKISGSKEFSANLKTMPQVGKHPRQEWATKHQLFDSFEYFVS